jgi:hypothetical protein
VNRYRATPARSLVHQVIMHQRGGVDQLDGRGRVNHAIKIIAAELGRQQRQRGANALAPRGEYVLAGDLDHRQARLHTRNHDLIDYLQIRQQSGWDGELIHKGSQAQATPKPPPPIVKRTTGSIPETTAAVNQSAVTCKQ